MISQNSGRSLIKGADNIPDEIFADVGVQSNGVHQKVPEQGKKPENSPEAEAKGNSCPCVVYIVAILAVVAVLALFLWLCPALRPGFLRPSEGADGSKPGESGQSPDQPESPSEKVLANRKDKPATSAEKLLGPMASGTPPASGQVALPNGKMVDANSEAGRKAIQKGSKVSTEPAKPAQASSKLFGVIPLPGIVQSAKAKYGSKVTYGGGLAGAAVVAALGYYYLSGTTLAIIAGLGGASYFGARYMGLLGKSTPDKSEGAQAVQPDDKLPTKLFGVIPVPGVVRSVHKRFGTKYTVGGAVAGVAAVAALGYYYLSWTSMAVIGVGGAASYFGIKYAKQKGWLSKVPLVSSLMGWNTVTTA